jgi:hypothetical protein
LRLQFIALATSNNNNNHNNDNNNTQQQRQQQHWLRAESHRFDKVDGRQRRVRQCVFQRAHGSASCCIASLAFCCVVVVVVVVVVSVNANKPVDNYLCLSSNRLNVTVSTTTQCHRLCASYKKPKNTMQFKHTNHTIDERAYERRASTPPRNNIEHNAFNKLAAVSPSDAVPSAG